MRCRGEGTRNDSITGLCDSEQAGKGLISGVKSAVVSGTTITFTMNDGTKVPMTFPTPKDGEDGVSVTNIEIKTTTNGNKKHLIFTMSDGSTIDSGELDVSGGGLMQMNKKADFPAIGKSEMLYLAKNKGELFYWDGSKYEGIISNSPSPASELKTLLLDFDGSRNTFNLPIDGIPYNVFVNGMYYTEGSDYAIDRAVSPNRLIFNDIYDVYDTCTLTYFKSIGSISCPSEGNVNLDFATKEDIDDLFANDNFNILDVKNVATKQDIDKVFT